MTPQELFDKAVVGLAAQGFKRAGKQPLNHVDSFRCQYLADDGKRCAIGHCVTEEQCQYFDRECVGANDVAHYLKWEPVPFFYGDLQSAHDSGKTPEQMKANLRRYATKYGLTAPTVLAVVA